MKTLLSLAALSLLALTSCSGHHGARAADGSAYTVEVYFDRATRLPNADQVEQVMQYMEPDLRNMLTHAGYAVVPTNDPNTFVPGPNRFLLVMRVTNYNPGSKAARMMVGWGAGSMVLDTQHVLYSGPGQIVFQGAGSVGSSRDWNYAAHKINDQVTREIGAALSKGR